VALFSDIDWIIIVAVAVFLLFGRGNGEVLRTLGRWYGRAGRIKQELLTEFTKAADLPLPAAGQPLSIRGALLGLEPPPARVSGIPIPVRDPPAAAPLTASAALPAPVTPWTGGLPVPTWSMTVPVVPGEGEVSR
jgi:hypothetical protein